ncbi:prephenate dehydrogenase/arogenate dehydrogenase family protein [Parablautia muri]|uniref:Prephenate dehydrogenase n=1 Tax=Parablautia muri TaxID=2320879 RepID=A0A9X5BDS3_9FIRM|nr:prephenate dehydrogenase [Parablautia muri]NBJ92179.1 prephenate dehydrogenase [Parablautia muri]
MKTDFTCGFVGLGLIGGSIARAIRDFYPDSYILAYDINQEALKAALADGVINLSLSSIGKEFSGCDYIFLCAPVSENDNYLSQIKKYMSPTCLLTDVGSVKTDIHRHIEQAGLSSQFIGGHPMAGSERTGYINSKTLLLQNAYYILTPCEGISQETIREFKELIASLGAIPLLLSYTEHDYVTAAISHLPHVAAASLVNLIRQSDSPNGIMKLIAAGGFKDITRIASSSPVMWQQICLTNGENISRLLDDYIHSLIQIKKEIDRSGAESLYQFFDQARIYRDSFIDASSGPIKKSFTVRIDIADEPGALAAIATILALYQISIKNIGITHNREQADGVLQVEFYEESSIKKAAEILASKGYTIYPK